MRAILGISLCLFLAGCASIHPERFTNGTNQPEVRQDPGSVVNSVPPDRSATDLISPYAQRRLAPATTSQTSPVFPQAPNEPSLMQVQLTKKELAAAAEGAGPIALQPEVVQARALLPVEKGNDRLPAPCRDTTNRPSDTPVLPAGQPSGGGVEKDPHGSTIPYAELVQSIREAQERDDLALREMIESRQDAATVIRAIQTSEIESVRKYEKVLELMKGTSTPVDTSPPGP